MSQIPLPLKFKPGIRIGIRGFLLEGWPGFIYKDITDPYPCFICKKEFSSQELLSQHSKRFHQGGVLQNPGQNCPICKAEFSNFTLLNQHVASKHQPSELRKKLLKWKYYYNVSQILKPEFCLPRILVQTLE